MKSKPPSPAVPKTTVVLKKSVLADLVRRLHQPTVPTVPGPPLLGTGEDSTRPSVAEQCNAAMGCKTSEVALVLLAQVVLLEHYADIATLPQERVDALLTTATAMIAELEPTTATEALLAAQMVGTQRLAMTFLHGATIQWQTSQEVDAHVLRATRLMRLFTEQVETMAKLKGKGGQQRVVVEHVTVHDGGQAIVGAVAATKAP